MEKLSNTEAELRKSVAYKKKLTDEKNGKSEYITYVLRKDHKCIVRVSPHPLFIQGLRFLKKHRRGEGYYFESNLSLVWHVKVLLTRKECSVVL